MTSFPQAKQPLTPPEVFVLSVPAKQAYPLLFNSPHSGRHYPDAFVEQSLLDLKNLRASEDFHVDTLFAEVTELGCPLLCAQLPRAYLDLNRQPWELDPKMFADQLPAHIKTTGLRIAAGLGTIPQKVSENGKIYRHKLTFAEAEDRINRFYFPYHAKLEQLLADTKKAFGQAVLLDCHSMPSSAVWPLNQKGTMPDIILGDRFGASSTSHFVEELRAVLRAQGFTVKLNQPYAGGYITTTYGKPRSDIHAIQIEINRACYMNEKALVLSDNFARLKMRLLAAMQQFLTSAFSQHAGTIAAE